VDGRDACGCRRILGAIVALVAVIAIGVTLVVDEG
jgi:hypothetical protein